MKPYIRAAAVPLLLLSLACASSGGRKTDEIRLLGQEAGVRVDALVLAPMLSTSAVVSISYDVENLREESIAIAELVPQTTYDPASRTVTVTFGSEVPGNQLVPRLIRINPGEKRTFKGKAALEFLLTDQVLTPPRYLQLRVNYLDDIRPFAKFIGTPEVAVADPAAADELFPQWVEHNVSVMTNSMPVRWGGSPFTADPRRPDRM